MAKKSFNYVPAGTVLKEFFWDRSPVSIIQGPVGSGTSTACCFKMWRLACEQESDALGYRRTRWLIVRNTYSDLHETTMKTWRYWFEQQAMGAFGELKKTNPPNHTIKWVLPDNTCVMAEFIFLSLDNEDDVSKLLSMEVTGIWFNEVQFSMKEIFDAAHSRAIQGRYPPLLDGGPTWKGVIADLNAPPEGHWIPYMRGDVPFPLEWDDDKRREYTKPDNWKFFVQPSGLIEVIKNKRVDHYVENNRENREKMGLEPFDAVAENTKWLTESYLELVKGKPKSWIDTFVMNRVGLYRKGKPVFESFRPEVHVSKERLLYNPEWPLIVGLDFARNPAAVMMQLIRGQMYVLDEFGMENVSAGTFAPLLKQRIMKNFPGAFQKGIQFWGDPTGGSKGQATDNTPFQIFRSNGMAAAAAPGNNAISLRLEAVESLLNKMVDGGPGVLFDMHLRTLKAGMGGAYHFARVQGSGGRYHETPYKDRFADYCDAFQYGCLGAGVGFTALNPGGMAPKPRRREKQAYSLRR